jgi:hypothetical protein
LYSPISLGERKDPFDGKGRILIGPKVLTAYDSMSVISSG